MRVMFVLVVAFGLAGCRTGYIADRFIDEPQIIAGQLTRYGFSETETQCVSGALAARLDRHDLREFEERAGALRRGLQDPARITPRDLLIVADGAPNRQVPVVLREAAAGCGMQLSPVAIAVADPGSAAATTAATVPVSDAETTPRAATPTWLNLGAAPSGQSISVDATTVEQDGTARVAWFRMTDPETGQATLNAYRLRIDCPTRMYAPLAWRRYDEAGAVVDSREYSNEVAPPQTVDGGTVTEIAYLSLCT